MGNATEHRPLLIVIAGPNGSGKTSVTSRLLKHEWIEDSAYVNPDNVAKEMFGDWNSKEAVLSAANYCAEWRERCLAEKRSLIFETVMSADDKVDFILRAKEAGFFVRVFFIATANPTINAARIAGRVMKGGHDVPITKIVSRYRKSIYNCIKVSSFVDRLYVYDNSVDGEEAKLQFRLANGVMGKMYVTDVPEWAQAILPDTEDELLCK